MDNKSIPKTVKLNNGIDMPMIGMGTYAIPQLDQVIYESIKKGLRLIDTAWFYGNEKEVGLGVNKAIDDKIVERKDVFVMTKVWYTKKHDPESSLVEQLKVLNLSYVDLYLDHFPFSINMVDGKEIKTPRHVFWKNMEGLVKKGLTKSIGVCNYNVQALQDILSYCEIKPVVNQVEFHPYLYQKGLLDWCSINGIYLIAYNSLCKGKYTTMFHNEDTTLNLLEEQVVKDAAKKYGKSVGQIALNWSLSQGVLIIPSSSKPERMQENMESDTFTMSNEDIENIGSLNKGYRFCSTTIQPGVSYDGFA